MNNFKFSVLTQNGHAFKGIVEKVIVTTSEGEITILKNHIPLIALTNKGRLVIYSENGILKFMANEGLVKIDKEESVLMSDKVEILK